MTTPDPAKYLRALLSRLACLAIGLASVAQADDGAPRPGVWDLVGQDTSRWRAEMMLTRQDDNRYTGSFSWQAVSGAPAGGTEPFRGEYDPTTRTLRLRGEPVQGATGNIASGAHYEASVACEGRYLAYGRWWGTDIEPGTWAARHGHDAETK
jgi:hypothetical protein